MVKAGCDRYRRGERLASAVRLIAALSREPASLFEIDEFMTFISTSVDKRRTSKHHAQI